jgi:hypothetical protein
LSVIALVVTVGRSSAVAVNLTALIFDFLLIGTLMYLVAAARSRCGVSIVMLIPGLPLFVQVITCGQLGSDIIAVIQGISQAVTNDLLFNPSSRRWMS